MSIGIFYDTLLGNGGAEKVVVQLADQLNAEIVTAGYDPTALAMKTTQVVNDIGNFTAKYSKSFGYLIEAPFRFYINKRRFNYDTEIYIGFTSIYGANRRKTNNIWYCLTPNRTLYDLRDYRLNQYGLFKKVVVWLYIITFSASDKICVNSFQSIVCQTVNVQERVKKYYGRNSSLLYPAIPSGTVQAGKVGNYFLAVSRLFPEKRMLLIAKAFENLPNEKLILVGDGPEKYRINEIVNRNRNIELKSNIPEEELLTLYKNCRATIYMPLEEDFGLVPLEGMLAGKPCIAVKEGGCRETVNNGKTGLLISANIADIQAAVRIMSAEWVDDRMDDCLRQAERFSQANCLRKWRRILRESPQHA